jgi:polar amino acid transport system ATP-binding protein
MTFTRRVADRVIFTSSGLIVEEGQPEEFFDKPKHDRTKKYLGEILAV